MIAVLTLSLGLLGAAFATAQQPSGARAAPGPAGEEGVENSVPLRFSSDSGMDIGMDNGDVVSPSYQARAPFAFTDKIGKVVFDLAPH